MVNVALFPSQNPVNPYLANLSHTLTRHGVVLFDGVLPLTQRWVLENQGRIQVLHLNWPSYYYAAPDLAESVRDLLLFLRSLSLAKDRGYRIVWTVHNIFGHEVQHTEVDHLAKVALARLADALIIHCRCARERIRDFFDRTGEDIFFIPHGNYIDSYPNVLTREQARSRLGLSAQEFVYLFFGYVRSYKGITQLVEAFQRQAGPHLRLVIAGLAYPASYARELAQRVRTDHRIRFDPKLIPAEDVQIYLKAADVVVLPFENILTSGSLILALSFGKPVIAPAMGGIPDLVTPEVGVLYDPLRPEALDQALAHVRNGFDLDRAGEKAYAQALELDWDAIGHQMQQVYTYVLQR